MPQLDPTWFASQLFWLSICFIALYFMLSRLVLPPLMQIMSERSNVLASDVETAQRLNLEAEQGRVDYEKTMAVARSDSQAAINTALTEQKAKGEAKSKELDKQIEQKLDAASAQIAAKKNTVLAELSPAALEITSMIVEKLTQAKPSSDNVVKALNSATKGGR